MHRCVARCVRVFFAGFVILIFPAVGLTSSFYLISARRNSMLMVGSTSLSLIHFWKQKKNLRPQSFDHKFTLHKCTCFSYCRHLLSLQMFILKHTSRTGCGTEISIGSTTNRRDCQFYDDFCTMVSHLNFYIYMILA